MHIVLCAIHDSLATAFEHAFRDLPHVTVHRGDILALDADALVSPANSFGWMDGGIDLHYRHRFGIDIERRAMEAAAHEPDCELAVGDAVVLPTGDARIPHLIMAPTMRFPQPVPASDNAYRAFSAALIAAQQNGFERILAPGMCTGAGRMPPYQAALQMARAYRELFIPPSVGSPHQGSGDVLRAGRHDIRLGTSFASRHVQTIRTTLVSVHARPLAQHS